MIALDTSALVRCFVGSRPALPLLEGFVRNGERLVLPALVVFEWRRGPRRPEELALQEHLFPSEQALAFDATVAVRAAEIYTALGRPRRRQTDIAIAASVLEVGASLWTMNERDFDDIPGLTLV